MTGERVPLPFASIRQLARMLRNGETTPTKLAEFYIERLERIGKQLNAVVTITRELALREAKRAEEELAAGHDRGLLHGIPYGAKHLLATSGGIPTTWCTTTMWSGAIISSRRRRRMASSGYARPRASMP
jgi:Asp-tRNA(Asn)/Glu-tRNA(Gln) amidotransferase A subunit family amidase